MYIYINLNLYKIFTIEPYKINFLKPTALSNFFITNFLLTNSFVHIYIFIGKYKHHRKRNSDVKIPNFLKGGRSTYQTKDTASNCFKTS